jgi:6-phosphofructokinase 1
MTIASLTDSKRTFLSDPKVQELAVSHELKFEAKIFDVDKLEGHDELPNNYPSTRFVGEDDFLFADVVFNKSSEKQCLSVFRRAGPRKNIVFVGNKVRAAIVSCGGLCPGLNNIIVELVRTLWFGYGVRHISGIRYGYRGFYDPSFRPYMELTPEVCLGAEKEGGSILGSSRGGFNLEKLAQAIDYNGFDQVYIIGGDGTHRGALKLAVEIKNLGLKTVIVGLPKTVDNDLPLIDYSFGFFTAVGRAVDAIRAASIEAHSYPYCVGLVKLMGRSAGFVAAHAALSSGVCDICIVPEVPVDLDSIINQVKDSMVASGTCIVIIAEGASNHFLKCEAQEKDPSGNPIIPDVGLFLKKTLIGRLGSEYPDFTVKYIDPSYMIRSVKADSYDAYQSLILAQNAVHGAMAGFTAFSSGVVNNKTVYIPFKIITAVSATLRPKGRTIERLNLATQQQRKWRSSRL